MTQAVTQEIAPSAHGAALYWLALGTFATGTEAFMIAPLLPDLARRTAANGEFVPEGDIPFPS